MYTRTSLKEVLSMLSEKKIIKTDKMFTVEYAIWNVGSDIYFVENLQHYRNI